MQPENNGISLRKSGSKMYQSPVVNELISCNRLKPFAMGDFHNKFLKDNSVVVGCPKLDDAEFYIEKLAAILQANKLNSLTVIHMEVPCCSGLTRIAQEAVAHSGVDFAFEDVTIGLDGNVVKRKTIS